MFDVQPTETDFAEIDLAEPTPLGARPRSAEHADLEMPGWIWRVMIAAYGTYFAGLLIATGRDREALFALTVSFGFAVIYFSTSGLLAGLNPSRRPSLFSRGLAPLQTWTGPMSTGAVAAQVLTVPLCLAFFGLAFAVIRAVVG